MALDSDLAPPSFLDHLKSLYLPSGTPDTPAEIVANSWYIVATVAYASCNRPEGVPLVFLYVLESLKNAQGKAGTDAETAHDQQLQVARRMRESLFRSLILCGAPRAINAMIALHEVMPEELRDKEMIRNARPSVEELDRLGGQTFHAIHGDAADGMQGLFNAIYPDFGWFSRVIASGLIWGKTDLLSVAETTCVMAAAIYGVEASRQFTWHIANAKREAGVEQARVVRLICMEVGERVGFKWREAVPDVQ